MAKTDVAVMDDTLLPAPLPPMPVAAAYGDDVSFDDIKLPRIYLTQPLSEFVQAGQAKPGEMVFAGDTNDYPTHLIQDGRNESFTAYVLTRKKFYATTANGYMEYQDARDPSDPDSWEGWHFYIAVPEYEDVLPIRWQLWKTAGRPAARSINTLIQRRISAGDTSPLPIKVSIRKQHSRDGKPYFAPVIGPTDGTDEGMAVAMQLREMAAALASERLSENDRPVVESGSQPSFS